MSPTLSQNEVDALMEAIQKGSVAPGPAGDQAAEAVTYDLTSQDRIIRGQMPTLDSINERIASMFGSGLAGRTRMGVRVTSSPASLLKFADIYAMITPPATVGVTSLGAGHGLALLLLEAGLAESLLAGALGDRKARADVASGEARRELTTVERPVLRRLLSQFTDAMESAWAEVFPLRPDIMRFEFDPRLCVIAPPNDVAILCSFEVAGVAAGHLKLAIPYAAVEPAKKVLAAPPRLCSQGDERFAAALAREIENVEVRLCAELGRATMTLAQLLDLHLGSVLTLGREETAAVPIYVEGRNKLSGLPRVVGGSLAVVVERGVATRGGSEGQGSKVAQPLPHKVAHAAAPMAPTV
jgi:flagellar motor switch protein FliM